MFNSTAKVRAELEKVLEAVKALEVDPSDKAAIRCLRTHMNEQGYIIIGNPTLTSCIMEGA